jgi:hypothetical protein
MTSALVERAPGETEVTITSQVNVMGILAQLGRGMIQDVSDQMFGIFVAAARSELEKPDEPPNAPSNPSPGGTDAAPPIDVLSLGSAAAVRAAARAASKPAVWAGFAIVVLVVLWWWLGKEKEPSQ